MINLILAFALTIPMIDTNSYFAIIHSYCGEEIDVTLIVNSSEAIMYTDPTDRAYVKANVQFGATVHIDKQIGVQCTPEGLKEGWPG